MKKLAIPVLLVSSMIAGCSGGGSAPNTAQNTPGVPTPPAAPMVKVRFVNATPRLGAVEFTLEPTHVSVAPRTGSPVFSIPPGSVTVTATASSGSQSVTRVFTTPNSPDLYFVSWESTDGILDLRAEQGTILEGVPGPFVTYANYAPTYSPEDVYVVPSGGSIVAMDPTFASQLESGRPVQPGDYSVVVTAAGKKTILFQSVPLTLSAGQQVVLVGAPASQYVVTPAPLILGLDAIQPLADSRPAVKVLPRIDRMTTYQVGVIRPGDDARATIVVEGDLIADFPSATAPSGDTYHLTPGLRTITGAGAGRAGIGYSVQVDAASNYVQRFGWNGGGTSTAGSYWLMPNAAVDYPIPTDRARVRLIVENDCDDTLVRVDGAAIGYGNQMRGNAGVVFDRAAGPLLVEVATPDGASSEGSRTMTLNAGHYYVVRVFGEVFNVLECSFAPKVVQRNFEISED